MPFPGFHVIILVSVVLEMATFTETVLDYMHAAEDLVMYHTVRPSQSLSSSGSILMKCAISMWRTDI